VYEKSLGMRHFRAVPCPEKAELAHSRAAEFAREEQDEENGSERTRLYVQSRAARMPNRKFWFRTLIYIVIG